MTSLAPATSAAAPQKRTTGRTYDPPPPRETSERGLTLAERKSRDEVLLRRLRLVFRLLALSPRASGALAERLFIQPRRFRRPAWEEELLASGRRFDFIGNRGRSWPAVSWGEGPTVALVHGWEGRGTQLGALVAPLVEAGCRVVAADAPGHGMAPSGPATVDSFAETLLRLSDWVGGLHGVVAHSFGGLGVAMAFLRGLDAERAVFIAPATSPRMATEYTARLLGMTPDALTDLQARLEERVGLALDEIEDGALYKHVTCPTLVVHDHDDEEVSVDGAEAVAEATGARVRWTRGLGHRRVLKDPGVASVVSRFVQSGRPAGVDPWRAFLFADHDIGTLGLS